MDKSFVDITKGITSHVGTFELEYGVKFMLPHIKNIVDDMMLSNHQPKLSRSSYLRQGTLARILSRNSAALPTPGSLRIENEGYKELWVSHLN